MKLDSKYNKRPDDPLFLDSIHTPINEYEAAYYLKMAWHRVYNEFPSADSLALLWAHSKGETGGWKYLRCYNWGNIKRRVKDRQLKWTSYEAGENLVLNGVYGHYMFYPYHPQTHFAAWEDPLDAAEFYVRFLSQRKRYKKAWDMVIKGDVIGYCRELKKAGYFTADLDHYTKGMVWLVSGFKKKGEELMAWKPKEEPPPPPSEPDNKAEINEGSKDEEPEPESEPDLILDLSPKPAVEPDETLPSNQNVLTIIMAFIMSILNRLKGK